MNKIVKSTIIKYESMISKIEKTGVNVISLILGQPDIQTDDTYFNTFKNYTKGINTYTDYRGMECLRNSFANYYNEKTNNFKFNKNNVQITLGASDAIISCLMTICSNSQDTILLIEPFFSDYKLYCEMLNIKFKIINIEDIISEKIKNIKNCKAILFSNPNNPSGYVFTRNEIEAIIKLAKEYDLYIISDEVYSEILYDKFISFSEYAYEKIIIVDSVSKKFNNCGARIGCIISKNISIINNISIIYDSRISLPNIEQIAVNNMFSNKDNIFKNNMNIYNSRKNRIQRYLDSQNLIKYEIPKGGVFFILILPVKDTRLFADWLLKKYRKNNETLAILSANDFYKDKKNRVRLPITYDSDYIIHGLNLMIDAIEKFKKEGEK